MARRAAIDANGEPLPWYTYPAIEYLRSFDFGERDVFEFGSGNSSRYWARRARRVVSVEDDEQWYRLVSADARENQRLLLRRTEDEYVQALADEGKFDIVIVDGKWRRRCIGAAADGLLPGGMIILDNCDWYPESARFLRERGFFQIDFSGFGPINAYCWTTSMFIAEGTRLQAGFVNPRPLGSLPQNAD